MSTLTKQGHDFKSEKEKKLSSDNGELENQLTKEIREAFPDRADSRAVDEIYERKVYIVNKVMNEHIGMGKLQWQIFLLSGWGWMCDNLWLQGVAIILPQVSREFNISSNIRWMTFALYCGLILGASIWGVLADVIGRRPSFNITLLLAGIFGIAGGAAPNFVALGGLLAALGFGLGGNLPVDGMMFLEFVPASSQYLLTLLSVFWSLGQLLASLVAWAFIANYSCDGHESNTYVDELTVPCNVANNKGWRYTFYTLGALTFIFWICRFFVFRLPESPKFYLAKGRDAEAVATLKEIARRNGTVLGDDIISVEILRSAAGQSSVMDAETEAEEDPRGLAAITSFPSRMAGAFKGVKIAPDLSHVKPLFSGFKMAYTTSVIFLLWGLIGLAYPLFNAFLPLYLSKAQGVSGDDSVYTTYRNYAIVSVCGVPGSLIAAWLVELPRSGRRGAMALGTVLTGVFLFAFTTAKNEAAVLAYSCVTSLTQQIMYGVLYGYTPEIFPAPHRGTADGIAASVNRILGCLAPIIGIYSTGSSPIYVAASFFVFSGLLMLTLQVESVGKSAL
ncbi:MFS general substrate transporter [Violaceomyces palustris]|uniref:MFS general substrate transporter n=1 Tax=Violaceomyces palustris TaxID=1673888 RepID=A0ACD0P1H6_9BASI|nr:MFS general substrate transporter [Violaceomyces palustris]